MARRLWLLVTWCATWWLGLGAAHAEVDRYALIIANNRGYADEAELRYAERDGEKLEGVLRDLGDFPAENVVRLFGAGPSEVRRTLISLNDRIRTSGNQAVLFVYYSGHADADGLHLGADALSNSELAKLVRGSAATIRLLVLDSCRSGLVTRRKGARQVAEFALAVDETLASDGVIFLSSSSANEDSQESDQLQGSFFTHFLVSGLQGAADQDGDASVTVDEAYRYAYDATIRTSSRTHAGTQHPTFRYDVRGQGRIVLTRLVQASRGTVGVPGGRAYLLLRDGEDGPVVAEVGASDTQRQVLVRPGLYFVRGRGRADLREGSVVVRAGQTTTVEEASLRTVAYARLVRKGGPRARAHALLGRAVVRTGMFESSAGCFGGGLGYRIDGRALSVTAAVDGCRARFRNEQLTGQTRLLGASVTVTHVWDLRRVSLEAGVVADLRWSHQTFVTPGLAPSRDGLVPGLGITTAASVDLSATWLLQLHVNGEALALRRVPEVVGGQRPAAELEARVVIESGLSLGLRL